MTVRFYDGDPGAGGRLFDVETIPHIRQDDAFQAAIAPPLGLARG